MGAHLKQLLASGRVVNVFGLGQLCYPKLVEMIGLTGGWDAVWLDQEHAGISIQQIEESARAARATGLSSFVRLTATDYATVMRALEAGAGGVMAAQIRSAQQAAEVVSWSKFHPAGCRGICASGADARYGTIPLADYFVQANNETFVAIQIEHAEAVAEVDKIAAIPGVDVLFIGPADLTQSLGIPAQWDHPELWKALEKTANAAQANGIHWAILPLNPAFARRCVDMGCRMLSIGFDVWAWSKGLKAFKDDYGAFMNG